MTDMIYHQKNGMTWIQFPHLAEYPDVRHAIFTRLGGFSQAPYNGLNVSEGNGDNSQHVHQNRHLIYQQMGQAEMVFARQIHGTHVWLMPSDRESLAPELPEADALVTRLPEKNLTIQVADCQAILIYDPVKRVIANIHSGWRGSIENIAGKTIETMIMRLGCSPRDMLAGVGPSLGPCCSEFLNFRREIPKTLWTYRLPKDHFDFWTLTTDQLAAAGIPRLQIRQSGLCTRCRTDLFFSYRREKTTGRFAAVIGMTDEQKM